MEFKRLGHTSVQVPEIGLGTWKYSGGPEALQQGLELGANLLDTAEIYGTERTVGAATRGRRETTLIATKVSGQNLRFNDVLKAAEGSLRRLDTEYIDLYQVHWPNPRVPIEETMEAMESLVDSSRVTHVGVSNFSRRDLENARARMRKYSIVSNQVHYSLLHRNIESELLPYCQEQGITVIAYTPLESGLLTSGQHLSSRHSTLLARIADRRGKTKAQVALNWCISHENVIAIPKSNSVERVRENCGASGWKLSRDELELLDDAFRVK